MDAPYSHGGSATSSAGLGYAGFANIPIGSGMFDMTITKGGLECVSSANAWDGDGANEVSVPIEAGRYTHVQVVCF
jgi:hypothetical protein